MDGRDRATGRARVSGVISVEEHAADIMARVRPQEPEEIRTVDASGRTLAASARAGLDVPAFDNSAMDGFAVRAGDVAGARADAPRVLPVAADIPAGPGSPDPLPPGAAARIMTGAPLPVGADAIVPFEATRAGLADSLERAIVERPSAIGAHVRRRAEDVGVGDEVLPAGTALGPLQVAALVAAGVARVRVAPRPRVVVVSTGAELVAPGAAPRPGEIPDSNSTLLALLARECGAEVTAFRVGDDPEELARLVEAHAGADAIVTSGGVSQGAYEPVRLALADRVDFRRVAMQPGKPQAFGALDGGALFFGLPGNPVSVAVSFELFVRPALFALQGRAATERPRLRLAAATGWRTPPARRQYLPVRVLREAWPWRVVPATGGGSGSHLAGGLGRAEGYAIVPEDVAAVAPGDVLDVMLVS
nr:gephyrin-like molybdotransferase Glp [Microbacterium excoecariae]